MQISVGKMSFNYMDKSFVPVEIPMHKECSCDEVQQKFIDHVSWLSYKLPCFIVGLEGCS